MNKAIAKRNTKAVLPVRKTVIPLEIAMRSVGRPVKFESPDQIVALAQEFFQWCIDNNKPLTVTGLALALGMTREGLMSYQEKDAFADTIKKLKAIIENYNEMQVHESGNAAGAIFVLKNFGWKDKSELEHGVSEDLTKAIDRTQNLLPD